MAKKAINYKLWTEKEIAIIKKYYEEKGATYLSKYYIDRDLKCISQKARKLGLESNLIKKRTKINSNYFSKPLSLQSCYWAGFIAADGNLGTKRKNIQINISNKDKFHLKKLKTNIGYSGKLTYVPTNDSIRLNIYDNKIHQDLIKNFNITPRKTYTLKSPKGLSKNRELAFIIGYIDGDGHIKKSSPRLLNILGTEKILEWINKVIEKNYNIGPKNIRKIPHANVYSLNYYTKEAIYILKKLNKIKIYKLKRKWKSIEWVL